ncbi:MAG: tetratricopeptide repeat protein [Pyrinomonadaceae bacterium]|nr:tetratricopeptide repeat protein [Pyrinomonadaceae bacterium]
MKAGCESQKPKSKRSIELPVLSNRHAGKGKIAESRTSWWRAAVLITLTLLMIAHIIQWWVMGTTVSPIEPSEAMYTIQNGAVNAGFIFFSLAIIATLIFGRFVCGWGCHIVALQDFCAWLLKKMRLTPKPFRSRVLIFVPLVVALYMFVWPTVLRLIAAPPTEPLIPQFTNHLITTEFWATFPPVWVAIPFLFICGFMTVYFLGSKGFCTYACPYGGFFAIADKFAPGKIRVTDACNECGHCTAVCTSNVIVHAEVKQYGMVVDQGCMKCMDCVSVCPNDALYFGFGKPAVGVPKTIEKNYSLSWPGEVAAALIFFVSFMAVWDVYQLVPMLMALGIACVTTYVVLRTFKMLSSSDLTFYRYSLKSAGTTKKAGWVFLTFTLIWTGLNIHSGWVRYHERAAAIAFAELQIPDELALARVKPDEWLSPSDRRNIQAGEKHFYAASRVSLFTNREAISKLAWLEYLSGDTENALRLLDRAADKQEGQTRVMSLYYRGAILNRLGRSDEAMASLDQALAERPDLTLALEEKGESLWRLGRREEAIMAWRDAIQQNPGLPVALNMIAGAAISMGRPETAASLEAEAARHTPADARFHWMLGLRLKNIGMNELADKQFGMALKIDPNFQLRLDWNSREKR